MPRIKQNWAGLSIDDNGVIEDESEDEECNATDEEEETCTIKNKPSLRNRSTDEEVLLTEDEDTVTVSKLYKYTHNFNDFSNLRTDEWGNKVDSEESDLEETVAEETVSEEKETVEIQNKDNTCEVCKKTFAKANNFARHVKNVHGSGRKRKMEPVTSNQQATKISKISLTCNECQKVFANAYNLKRHMKIH